MAMQVETYEVQEVEDQTIENNEESLELIKSLGLEGQQSLINPEKTTTFPYRKMTKEEGIVYDILLPNKCKVGDFKEEQIPLRVLQVLAHAKNLDFFDDFFVMYPENADVKDPVLYGMKKEGYNEMRFILARWGEVLQSIPELTKIAMKKFAKTARANAVRKENEILNKVAQIKKATDEELYNDQFQEYWSRSFIIA